MPKTEPPSFGSQAWANNVFKSPPARVVKGRTKWTHRHAPWVVHLNRLAYVESRGELIGLLALEYLQRRGHLKRFKEQPFTTPLELWKDGLEAILKKGSKEYTPDFMAEDPSRVKYVIEIKTKRYITRAMEQGFDLWREKFAEYGMKYLLWTDLNPLSLHLRQNLLRLRRASAENIEPDDTSRLMDVLRSKGPLPVSVLHAQDLDLDLIAHAVWGCHVYLPLLEPISEKTLITLAPTEDLAAILFSKAPDLDAWWNSLEAARWNH
jgi:hypothetical protein